MKLSGLELRIIPSVLVYFNSVPFGLTRKPEMDDEEQERLSSIDERVSEARRDAYLRGGVDAHQTRDAVRSARLAVTGEVSLSAADVRTLLRVFDSSLAEIEAQELLNNYPADFLLTTGVSEYGVTTQHLRSVRDRLSPGSDER